MRDNQSGMSAKMKNERNEKRPRQHQTPAAHVVQSVSSAVVLEPLDEGARLVPEIYSAAEPGASLRWWWWEWLMVDRGKN